MDVALVGPSALVRAGIETGLRARGGFAVVLQAPAWPQARAAGFGQAQVVVVDAAAGDDEALDSDDAPPRVLLLSDDDAAVRLGREAHGGIALLPPLATIEQIAAAAHAVAAGLVCAAPALWPRAEPGRRAARRDATAFEPLTPREAQVLQQMSFGLGNRQIAQALEISPHTAKFHVAQVIAKLQAGSRAHAVANALRAGLVEDVA
jgi:DNA-binding NarL/FixJ family response regulator